MGFPKTPPGLQAGRLVPFKVWIVSPEDQALQALSVRKNILGNMFPLRGEKVSESVDRLDNTAVDECIVPRGLDVTPRDVSE